MIYLARVCVTAKLGASVSKPQKTYYKSKYQSGPKYRTFISSLIASNDIVIGQCSFVYIMVWWRMSSLLTRIDFNVNPGTDK